MAYVRLPPDFAQKLEKAMREAGLTINDLAERAGVSSRVIKLWLKGQPRARDDTLVEVVRALGVPWEYFFPSPPPKIPVWARPRVIIPVVAVAVLIAAALALAHWTTTHAVVKVDGREIGDFDDLQDRPVEVAGKRIGVYDALLDRPLWEAVHESNVMVCVTAPWANKKTRAFAYGLTANAPDGGTLLVRNFNTGKKLWSYRPTPSELVPAYGEDLAQRGGFHCQWIFFADFEGDGKKELVGYFKHSSEYMTFLRMFDRTGRVYGTYYFNGHLSFSPRQSSSENELDVAVQDFDKDGKDEILAAGTNNAREYKGAMLVLLDGEHCRGASMDANALPNSTVPDSALNRVVLPMFEQRFAKRFEERLRAFHIRTDRDPAGGLRIKVNVGIKDSCLVVVLDEYLSPLEAEPNDALRQMMRRWPEDLRRDFDRYVEDEWLDEALLYAARPLEYRSEVARGKERGRLIRARRCFGIGLKHLERLQREAAIESLQEAVKYDSTYARAWLMLLHPDIRPTPCDAINRKIEQYVGQLSTADSLFWRAYQAHDRGDFLESMRLLENVVKQDPKNTEAYRLLSGQYVTLRDFDRAIKALEDAIGAVPSDGRLHNRLAYVYVEQRKYDKALDAIGRYIELAPSEPNPYDTKGDILTRMGRLDDALTSYETALAKDPGFAPSLQSSGCIYLLKRDYASAGSRFRTLGESTEPGARARSRFFLACIPIYQGQFKEAVKQLDFGLELDEQGAVLGDSYLTKMAEKALLLSEMGETSTGRREFEELLALHREKSPRALGEWAIDYTRILVNDDLPAAEAFLDSLRVRVDSSQTYTEYLYDVSKGWVELSKGNADSAVVALQRAVEKTPEFYLEFPLALAYLKSGRPREAVDGLQRALNYPTSRVRWAIWGVKSYYYLGLAYKEAGDNESAAKSFEEFLEYWGRTDVPVKEVDEAQRMLAELRSTG